METMPHVEQDYRMCWQVSSQSLSRPEVKMSSLWMMANSPVVLEITVDGTVCGFGCPGLEFWWQILYKWSFNPINFYYYKSLLFLTYLVAPSHGLHGFYLHLVLGQFWYCSTSKADENVTDLWIKFHM